MILDGGVGAPRKVLEAYMGEVGWPAEPTQGANHVHDGKRRVSARDFVRVEKQPRCLRGTCKGCDR